MESKGLLSQIKCPQLIACSVMFKKLLLRTQGLSDVLQSKELDLAAAMDLVETAIESLTKWRKQRKSWIKVWKEVEEMCRINEVPLELPSAGRRTSQHSRQMDDYIVMETAGQRRNTLVTSDGVETHYRVSVYYPILDTIIAEMNRRFSDENRSLLLSTGACIPDSKSFLKLSAIKPLIDHYKLNEDNLSSEVHEARQYLAKQENIQELSDVIVSLLAVKQAFPELLKLLNIALTLGVTTASCERSFSCLKRLKTYLRSAMTEERLSSMALLAIERDMSETLDLERAIDTLSLVDGTGRRLKLLPSK